MTRLPRLLDANLAEVRRLHPTAATVTLNLTGVSEGSLTLPDGATIPPMHSFVELYTDRGSAGIFRVTNVSQTFLGETELTLRHARDTFSDSLWEAQEDFEGTVAEYLARAASFQSRWTVGTVECAETVKRTMNYDRLNGLLDGLESDYPDFCFTYDTTVSPWVLNFVQKPADVACEFRIRRNMVGCTVTLDDSDLCNIVTVSANHQKTAKNGTVSTDTVYRTYTNDAAVARWGAIHRPADIDVEEDVKAGEHAETDAWAARFLAERADPTVQIDVDGLALAALTGDAWDEPALGQLARVSVPEYDAFFAERVVSITWPDLLEDPRSIRLSLANVLPSFSESLAKVQSAATKAGKAAKRAATTAKEATSWSMIVSDIDETVSGVGLKEYYESGIIIDARDGVKIYTLQEGMQALNAVLKVNKTGVSSLVAASGAQLNADGSLVVDEDGKPVYTAGQGLYSLFEQTASDISAEATRAQLAEGGIRTSLSGYLTIEAGRAQMGALLKEGDTVVSRANLFAMINDDGSSTGGIKADKIILSGSGGSTVTLSDKATVLGALSVQNGSLFVGGPLYATGDIQSTGNIVTGAGDAVRIVGNSSGEYYDLSASNLPSFIKDASVSADGLTLTLTKVNGQTVNFNKAASVTPTLTGAWNGGVYTVTSDPAAAAPNTTTLYDLGLGTATKGSGSTVEATYDIGYAAIVDGQQRRGGSTGKTGTLSLNVSGLLETPATITANGTYTPGAGYLGLASVTVDVPQAVTPTLEGTWRNGTYTVRAIVGSSTMATDTTTLNGYTLGSNAAVSLSGSNVQVSRVSPTYNGTQTGGVYPGTEFYGTVNVPKSLFDGVLEALTVMPSEQGATYVPSSGKIGFSSVEVLRYIPEEVNIDEKPDAITQNGTYYASTDGLDGYSSVVVNVSGGGTNYTAQDITITPSGAASDRYNYDTSTGATTTTLTVLKSLPNTTQPLAQTLTIGITGLYNRIHSEAYEEGESAGYSEGYEDGKRDAGGSTNRAVNRVQLSPIYDSTGHSVGTTFVFRYSDGTNTSFKSSGMAVTTTYTCTGNLS